MTPIYICGCDRSGTTMLGSMIGAHSQCAAIPETHFFIDVLRYFRRHGSFNASKFLERIKQHWRFQLWNFSLTKDQERLLSTCDSPPALLAALINMYLEKEAPESIFFWVDHTPSNVEYLSTLFSFYPKAKAIHLVRDGRAVASSVIPLDWGPINASTAASWWKEKIVYGLAAETAFPNSVLRIRYEDVLRAPACELDRIQQFLNLPLENLSEKKPRFNIPEYTENQHRLVGKPPDLNRAVAWQFELSSRDIETVEYLTGELLSYLGYVLTLGLSATPPPTDTIITKLRNHLKLREKRQQRKRRILKFQQYAKQSNAQRDNGGL